MNYILYHYEYSGNEYTEMVVNAMKESCNLVAKRNEGWFEYTQQRKTWEPLKSILKILEGNNNVINWGNHIFKNDDYFVLNVPSAIARTSHKTIARKILQDHKVKVPKTWFWNVSSQIIDGVDLYFPLIARPPKHEKGKGFNVVNSTGDLKKLSGANDLSSWYFSQIFNKTNEFRVHVAHGKILLINEKPFVKGNLMSEMQVNREDWWALRWSEFRPSICMEAIKATEILGLDYAAVDVMFNSNDNSLAICELNTDPDVGVNYTAGKYAAYFDWAIRHDFPAHFKVDGTSVFYNNLLKE